MALTTFGDYKYLYKLEAQDTWTTEKTFTYSPCADPTDCTINLATPVPAAPVSSPVTLVSPGYTCASGYTGCSVDACILTPSGGFAIIYTGMGTETTYSLTQDGEYTTFW